jgi:DNA-binding Lrp family transcriptional regulator
MGHRLDEIDKRIIYRLVDDARNTSAPAIADEVSVSAATIRNRIQQLEEQEIIQGYHARVDYERTGGRLTNVYECTAPVPNRDRLTQRVRTIPGVVTVRELMTGHGNLRITAVGENMRELSQIARELADLGIEIVDEDLLQREYVCPYHPFGPEEGQMEPSIADVMPLSGDAEVVTLTVPADAPIAEKTLQEANQDGLIDDDVLIVSIEREETVLTPRGDTRITPNDLVTVFARSGISGATLETFNAA